MAMLCVSAKGLDRYRERFPDDPIVLEGVAFPA
jgi:hypothetical protein